MKILSVSIIRDGKFLLFISKKALINNKSATEIYRFVQMETTNLHKQNCPEPNTFLTVNDDNYRFVVASYNHQDMFCTAIVDDEYPKKVLLYLFLSLIKNKDNYELAKAEFKEYQKPEHVNRVYNIQKDLEELRSIMVLNVEKILQRGERLEDLVASTDMLSKQSKEFLKKSKKMRKCCFIL